MARYSSKNEKQYTKLMKEGFGQGTKSNYKPWLTVRDVPSEGLSSRIPGWKTERIHHFLSLLELSLFYVLEWAKPVTDIREQFPLPLEETTDIANRLGIKHPSAPGTDERIVMTTDFLINVDKPRLFARSVKPSSALASKRTIEKMLIEKTYWEGQGIDFKIITEREIPKTLSKNVEFVHMNKRLEESPGITKDTLRQIEPFLFEKVSNEKQPLSKAALDMDAIIGLDPGSCLWIIKHLIANRYWEIDMLERIDTSKPLKLIRTAKLEKEESMTI